MALVRRLRRVRDDEDGVALIVAMMAIMLIAMLSAVFAGNAVQVNDTSTEDRDAKRALGAAEAGLNTALDRLDTLLPLDSQCLADGPIEVLATSETFERKSSSATITVDAGQCAPSADERAGNGGSFHYYVSPALSASSNGCNNPVGVAAGTTRQSLLVSGLTVLERCVTAVGTVNGVTRRVQRRAFSTIKVFNGLTAVSTGTGSQSAVKVSGGAALGGAKVNSNGQVTMNGATYSGQMERYRVAPVASMESVVGAWSETTRDTPFALQSIDAADVLPTANANDSTNISCRTALLLDCFGDVYNSNTRVLSINAGQDVTLTAPGDYVFCGIDVKGGTLIASAEANVYVDKCPSGPGTLTLEGGTVGTPLVSGALPNLRFFVASDKLVTIKGSALDTYTALIYAPDSKVDMRDSGTGTGPLFTGAISSDTIDITGNLTTFTAVPDINLTIEPDNLTGRYEPGDWVQCRSTGTSGLPHSNCSS